MKKISLLLVSVVLFCMANAQKVLTLKECIDIAVQNNQTVKDAAYQSTINKLLLRQSQYRRLPVVNVNLNQGLNTGRSIDPFSNQFIDQTINFGNYGVNLDVTLFNGFQISNAVKRDKATYNAGELEKEATKNVLILSVIRNYLLVVSSQEIINATQLQLASTQEQLRLSQQKVDAGTLAEGQLSDLNGQAATEELSINTAKNNLELAKLDLFLAMNYDNNEPVTFKGEEPVMDVAATAVQPDEVYAAALKLLPDVQNIEQQKRAAEFDRAVAKGMRSPVLSIFANGGSTYSSSVNKTQFVPDGTSTLVTTTSKDNFITVGTSNYFIQQTSNVKNGTYKPFTYFNQVNANRNSTIGLSLQIPILNGFQAKLKTATANAAIRRIDGELLSTKNQLKNAVERSVQNLKNAAQRIVLVQKQVTALQQTLGNNQLKMDNGIFNMPDYVIAKSNYDKSKIDLIQAKYEYQLLQVIVQFYQKGSW